MTLDKITKIISGTPQFRIQESYDEQAPIYSVYNQFDLSSDLANYQLENDETKDIRTYDKVCTLEEGDIIFSLISGIASIVRKSHQGYLYSHNYVKLEPDSKINSKYLIYLLNEDSSLKKQLRVGLQGSQVMKYTLKQIKELNLPKLPAVERQECIGDIYLKQLQVESIKKRKAELETLVILSKLKGE